MPSLVKHGPTGSNHLKNFNNSFSKEVQKGLLYPHVDFLIPVVFYVFDSLIPSIFQNRSCCNFFIRFNTVKFRGAFRTQSKIYGRTFRKSSLQFFQLLTIFANNTILDIWQGPECGSEYVYSNVVKETCHVKTNFCIKLDYKY